MEGTRALHMTGRTRLFWEPQRTVTFTALLAAYTWLGASSAPAGLWKGFLWVLLAALWLLNVRPLRKALITRPFLKTYLKLLPRMSQTEKEALEAGTVWWDGELFTGAPRWEKLLATRPPQLSAAEQAFLDGPCEELCRMLDEWEITHELGDLPPQVWEFLKTRGFFAMIIPKRYGGLEFSAYGHSCVLAKIASHSATASSTVDSSRGVTTPAGPIRTPNVNRISRWTSGAGRGRVTACSRFGFAGSGAGRLSEGRRQMYTPVAGAMPPALSDAQPRSTSRARLFLRIPRRVLHPPR